MVNYGLFLLLYLIAQLMPADKERAFVSFENMEGQVQEFIFQREQTASQTWTIRVEDQAANVKIHRHNVMIEGNEVDIQNLLVSNPDSLQWTLPLELELAQSNPNSEAYREPKLSISENQAHEVTIKAKRKNTGIYFPFKIIRIVWE